MTGQKYCPSDGTMVFTRAIVPTIMNTTPITAGAVTVPFGVAGCPVLVGFGLDYQPHQQVDQDS